MKVQKTMLVAVTFALTAFVASAQVSGTSGTPTGNDPGATGGTAVSSDTPVVGDPSLGGNPGSFVNEPTAVPTLSLTESQAFYTFQLTGGASKKFMVLFFGVRGGTTYLDYGAYGAVNLDILAPSFPQLIGPFDQNGATMFMIDRPATLPRNAIGLNLALQGVCVDFTSYLDMDGMLQYSVSLTPTNVISIYLQSQATFGS